MASTSNTSRSKRKYNDARKAATARNRASKKAAAERRTARLIQRTQDLIGVSVTARTKDGPLVGKIRDVLRAPEGSKRTSGQFVRVVNTEGDAIVSRHRIKINA